MSILFSNFATDKGVIISGLSVSRGTPHVLNTPFE